MTLGDTGGGDTGTTVGGSTTETSDLSGRGNNGRSHGADREWIRRIRRTVGLPGPRATAAGNWANRHFNSFNRQSIQSGGSSSQQRAIRPSFRLGFVPSQALISRNRRRSIATFNSITPRVRTLRNVSIAPDQNGTVTLRGQANSRYDLLLAAAIARLQPGVRAVRNEIVIEARPIAVPLNPGFVPVSPAPNTLAEPPAIPATPATPLP